MLIIVSSVSVNMFDIVTEYRSKHRKAKTPNTKTPKAKTPKTKTPKDQNTEGPKHRKYTFLRC